MLRPFFRYYGSKWSLAKYYGPPRRHMVIEPFAGGAGYSMYWSVRHVKLYDIDDNVCALWDFLINCSNDDIARLPDWIESAEQVYSLPVGARNLVGRWVLFSGRMISKTENISYYKDYVRWSRDGGEWKYSEERPLFWSPKAKQRIIFAKSRIKEWTIEQSDYRNVSNQEAHWHIDPPYQKQMKAYNSGHSIEFPHLSAWCRSRDGAVDVCEQDGADWLEFKPLKRNVNLRRNNYTELIWRNERTELF